MEGGTVKTEQHGEGEGESRHVKTGIHPRRASEAHRAGRRPSPPATDQAVRRRSDVAAAAEEEAAERGGEDDGLGGVEDVEERVVEEGHHDPRLLLPPPLVRPRALHLHLHDLEPPERHGLPLTTLLPSSSSPSLGPPGSHLCEDGELQVKLESRSGIVTDER